jgi:hypothetical protein
MAVGEPARLAGYVRDSQLEADRRRAFTGLIAKAAGGVATAGVYVALGILLAISALPLAVAGTAVLAIRAGPPADPGALAAAAGADAVIEGLPVAMTRSWTASSKTAPSCPAASGSGSPSRVASTGRPHC